MRTLPAARLAHRVEIPRRLWVTRTIDGRARCFAGDVRVGDLNGDGAAEILVYRSVDDAHDGGGLKPVFFGATDLAGRVLWTDGEGGDQPSRPGPVAVYDIDDDGADEIICFFRDAAVDARPDSLADVVLQVRDGRTGAILRQSAPREIRSSRGRGPNWVHQRILIANLRGSRRPRDFVVKLGTRVLACTDQLEVLWSYESEWQEYGRCPAYIPAVGDIDNDGLDEVLGGYYLLDHDGTPLWEARLSPHMDSVTIARWDGGAMRAVCSGGGHVMDASGRIVLALGERTVPHGQEVRVARFLSDEPEPQMAIRYDGHRPDIIVVDTAGRVRRRLRLNESLNNTGMESVYWSGVEEPALLYNGGVLWDLDSGESLVLPGLPEPEPIGRMAWYHCIPGDFTGGGREDVLLYNPWNPAVYIYTQQAARGGPTTSGYPKPFRSGPRQYNARLMD